MIKVAIYEYEYDTEYLGKCTYKQYNLTEIPDLPLYFQ